MSEVTRIIVAGGRKMKNRLAVEKQLNAFKKVSARYDHTIEIVSGLCRGPDMFGLNWAKSNGIPYKEFPADWDRYGNAAGPKRNEQMAKYADVLLLFWDGKSKGSRDMLQRAHDHDLAVKEFINEY